MPQALLFLFFCVGNIFNPALFDACEIEPDAQDNKDNDGNVNAKWTYNVFLRWSEDDGCYIVTSCYMGSGSAPNRVLEDNEVLLAVHGDAGTAGNVNRMLAATFKRGDKIGIYGFDLATGKLSLAPYAAKIVEPVTDEYALGDVNGDDSIDAIDYAMAKRAVLKTFDLDEDQTKRADVDKDGEISAIDYAMIKRHVLGTYKIEG